jgi:Concanavalin A-like lectin/glucanases superfamily
LSACGRVAFDDAARNSADPDPDAAGGDAPSTVYASTVMADTPAAYLRFEDAIGSNIVADSSGNGRNGTLLGMFELGVEGAFAGSRGIRFMGGGPAIFDGGFATFDGEFKFADRAPFTIECWHRPDVVNTDWRILAGVNYWTATRQGYTFEYNLDRLGLDRRRDSNDESATMYTAVFTPGIWTHVASTYDGSTLALYVDGAPTVSSPSTLMIEAGGVEPFNISNPTYTVTGTVDECAVWERALPADRIAAHYAARGL